MAERKTSDIFLFKQLRTPVSFTEKIIGGVGLISICIFQICCYHECFDLISLVMFLVCVYVLVVCDN